MAQTFLILKNALLFLNILGLAAIGFFTWTELQKSQNKIAPKVLVQEFFDKWDEQKGIKKEEAPTQIERRAALPLDIFVANLAEVDETSYYITFYPVLTFDSESGVNEDSFAPHVPKVRDQILKIINIKTKDEILAMGGKAKLKDELRAALNTLDLPYLVKGVFFTGLIVQ
ncbi:MAG: flagellar basal body-associated FliL family protein [Deltaproteobacteria bacterium]|nr:MAG: flagellar basal body-associated FliL family protein [Deltaproteobacteria bacterium]